MNCRPSQLQSVVIKFHDKIAKKTDKSNERKCQPVKLMDWLTAKNDQILVDFKIK